MRNVNKSDYYSACLSNPRSSALWLYSFIAVIRCSWSVPQAARIKMKGGAQYAHLRKKIDWP